MCHIGLATMNNTNMRVMVANGVSRAWHTMFTISYFRFDQGGNLVLDIGYLWILGAILCNFEALGMAF